MVGIGRLVRLEWLEETASLVAAGNDKQAVHDALDQLLFDKISLGGNAPRSGRAKAITVLLKTWLLVPRGLEALRDDGLALWNDSLPDERFALHWGMLLAAYPFWGAVAAHTGRLVGLQGHAAAPQVQRRIREDYGQKPAVERAARYVLRSFVAWGALRETTTPGAYEPAPARPIRNPRLAAWLAEAVLRSRSVPSAAPRELLGGPRLFPLRTGFVSGAELASLSSRLECVQLGFDEELLMLRRIGVPPPRRRKPPRLALGPRQQIRNEPG